MCCQKSAQAIVGAHIDRRAEQVVPKLGRLILSMMNEAKALAREADYERTRQYLGDAHSGVDINLATNEQTKSENHTLIEQVVARRNMQRAYRPVMSNHGAPGIDGMRCEDLKAWLIAHWPKVKQALLEGRYIPQAVRKVDIPKPQGGVRTLGVPTVVDRLIQQALHQVMQPIFERTFSEHRYGFRPKRSAQQAVLRAVNYIRGGKRWVVDLDLEKFFDQVNHDILMSRVAKQVSDTTVLKLVRRYLQAGRMSNGIESTRAQGTPQGGPLSPLLSNLLLTDLDRELEKRQLAFCRYADDCNIDVASRQAGERIMGSLKTFLGKRLRLTMNEAKSAVARPWERKFLGYSTTNHQQTKIRIVPKKPQAPARAG